jgi:hypothetical protein
MTNTCRLCGAPVPVDVRRTDAEFCSHEHYLKFWQIKRKLARKRKMLTALQHDIAELEEALQHDWKNQQ